MYVSYSTTNIVLFHMGSARNIQTTQAAVHSFVYSQTNFLVS